MSWWRKCFSYSSLNIRIAKFMIADASARSLGKAIRLEENQSLISYIIIRLISSCDIPLGNIPASSKTCEKGPCPTSCNKIAAMAAVASLSVISTPFSRSEVMASCIRCIAPKEWRKRLCIAPGYTKKLSPNWRIRFRRCM